MRPRIRSETICYVLAGISKEASDFVRFKYAGDETRRNKVARELTDRVLRRHKKSKRKSVARKRYLIYSPH